MRRELTFNLTEPAEAEAFAATIAALNAKGIPLELFNDGAEATIRVGEGY